MIKHWSKEKERKHRDQFITEKTLYNKYNDIIIKKSCKYLKQSRSY